MTIKSRFLVFTALVLLAIGFFSWTSLQVVTEEIIYNWVGRYAEKQIRYDKARTFLPLIHEVKLSQEFSEIDSLKRWAKQPNNDELKQQAFHDTESFRSRFSNNSYFIALKKNNHYYYSEKNNNNPSVDFYRYTLKKDNPADSWFYDIMQLQRDLHLNVNPDDELGVIKLWSDALIRDGSDILGVAGTGLDLSEFLSKMVTEQDIFSGIVFTTDDGAIQLYQKAELIDYASITKSSEDKNRVFQLLDDDSSEKNLRKTFELAKSQPDYVKTTRVLKDGVKQLASIIYIAEIEWFQVNFIDVHRFLPLSDFSGIFLVFSIGLIFSLVVSYLLIHLIVTRPIDELCRSINLLGKGKYKAPKIDLFTGLEIRHLFAHYERMSLSLLDYQKELEKKVTDRTEKLESLSKMDPLTGLYNRRGFESHLLQFMKEWESNKTPFSLINIDVDKFKRVNDLYGHLTGDLVLQKIGDYIKDIVRENGIITRWGGDEFLVLTQQDCLQNALPLLPLSVAEKLQKENTLNVSINNDKDNIQVKFSVGVATISNNDSMEDMLQKADKDMYEMKFSHSDSQI